MQQAQERAAPLFVSSSISKLGLRPDTWAKLAKIVGSRPWSLLGGSAEWGRQFHCELTALSGQPGQSIRLRSPCPNWAEALQFSTELDNAPVVVAVGGRTTLDFAKLVAHLRDASPDERRSEDMSTLVLCPIGDGTRAQDLRRGVGWEVNGGRTPFELRTNPADLVIEDPGFSQSIAPEHALLEGLQVFACALDGLINANARTETDEVFLRTLAHMPALMRRLAGKTVDPDALEALFWLAAEVEAVAPRPGLAVLGAVADALYFRFKLHRGLSSATMLVPLLDRLAADDAEREKAIGRALGCETSPAAASIAGLLTELGIARRLSFAIGPEAVDNVERALAGHDDAVNFPRWIGEADLPGMLRQGLRTVTSDGPAPDINRFDRGVSSHHFKIANYNIGNPSFTIDAPLSPSSFADFASNGYMVCNDLFARDEVSRLVAAVDEVVDEEMKNPEREYYPGNGIFVRHLLDKSDVFSSLLKDDRLLSVVRTMLGPQIQITDMVARVTFFDDGEQRLMWHIHNRVVPFTPPYFFSYPHSVDALIYLDEIGTDTGSLVVLPGSHRQHDVNFTFRNNDDVDGQVVVKPTAGTCVFCHSNLWHRVTTAKQQAGRRRVLLLGYMPAWFKRELPRGIRPAISRLDDLRYDGDQETRELLGEFQWR